MQMLSGEGADVSYIWDPSGLFVLLIYHNEDSGIPKCVGCSWANVSKLDA